MGFDLIPILSGFSSLLILMQPRQTRGWRLIAFSILGLLAIGWTIPPLSAFLAIACLVWAIFLLIPVQGFAQVERLVSQEKFQRAAKLMSLTRWLHPFDGWWDYPQLLRGLALAQAGQLGAAQQIFQQHQTGKSAIERLATILLYRLNCNWAEFVNWVQQNPPDSPTLQDPNIQLMYLRSLGELGQVNQLLDALQQFTHTLQKTGNPIFINTARMYALAFCGESEQLVWFLDQYMQGMPIPTKQFWQATAHWYAGDQHRGTQLLQALQPTATPGLTAAITARLAQPTHNIQRQLNRPSQHYLAQLRVQIVQQRTQTSHQRTIQPRLKQIPITASLIAINVAISMVVFGALLLVATMITDANQLGDNIGPLANQLLIQVNRLYNLGVLYPDKVAQGEWWRLLTAIFLHASWIHLLSNMIGLYVLGGIVEPILGKYRYAIGYFATGIGSMASVSILANLNLIQETAVVGASGAIMGLLGIIGVIFLIRWRQHREAIAMQRLKMVGLIIVFQTIFDIMTPRVSMSGHLSGLGLGFVMGFLLMQTLPQQRASSKI